MSEQSKQDVFYRWLRNYAGSIDTTALRLAFYAGWAAHERAEAESDEEEEARHRAGLERMGVQP